MLRPAANAKQAADFHKFASAHHQPGPMPNGTGALLTAAALSKAEARALVPAIMTHAVDPQSQLQPAGDETSLEAGPAPPGKQQVKQQRQRAKQHARQQPQPQAAALHVPHGVTLHPQRYMQALWLACQQAAAQCQPASTAELHIQHVESVAALQQQHGPFDAVVVAAGAAVGSINEVGEQLPLDLCQGYTLDLEPPAAREEGAFESTRGSSMLACPPAQLQNEHAQLTGSSLPAFPTTSPSILGTPYLASQGGECLVVGATQDHNWSTQRALAECGRSVDLASDAAAAAAVEQLFTGAAALWPPVGDWAVRRVRSGVRALPPRSAAGAVPMVGRWPGKHG